MEPLLRDLRYAGRAVRRAPAFLGSMVLALALAIGVCGPVLALVRAGMLRPAPYTRQAALDGATPAGWRTGWTAEAVPPSRLQDEGLHALLLVLLGLTLLAILVACTNAVILLLARATARRHELTMRAVLGAGRGRLLRQLLTEGALLGLLSAAPGVLLGAGGLLLLRALWPVGVPRLLGLTVDAWVLALAVGIPIGALLLCGVLPARAAARRDLYRPLAVGDRATAGRAEGAVRNALVVLAIAASMVLLSGAGLLLRGALPAHAADGREPDARDTLTAQLALEAPAYADPALRAAAQEEILARIRRIPGVTDTSLSTPGAWVGLGAVDRVRTVCQECFIGTMYLPISQKPAQQQAVSPGFFRTHRVPLLRGREFGAGDGADAPGVAVINETFAYRLFPNGEPLGKQLQLGGPEGAWYTVVGVVRDVRARGIGTAAEPMPTVYLSTLQHPPRSAALAVRATGDPLRLASAVRAAVRAVDPRLAPAEVTTLQERLVRFRAPLRWFGFLFAGLAGLGLLLAALGLYGVMAYAVTRRTREIGVRMALGAQIRQVVAMVLRDSLRLARAGMLIGIFGALSLARLLQYLFHGVPALDPLVYGGVALLLGSVALLAALRPALRAARVEPTLALRSD